MTVDINAGFGSMPGFMQAAPSAPPQAYSAGPMPVQHFVSPTVSQTDLLRKEQALGVVREIVPPEDHIGLTLFPFLAVDSDDVIFDYAKGLTTGLAPARAENAESELAMKDVQFAGQGRASIIDWALKDHYDANDVARYRDLLALADQAQGGVLPLTLQGQLNNLPALQARDTAERRRRLDNRLEKLIMDSISDGTVGYNDGRIKFLVDWDRPAGQEAQAPASGTYASTTHDPIGDINLIKRKMYNLYGIKLNRAICSNRFLNSLVNSDKFALRSGFVSGVTNASLPYILDGWGPQAAIDVIQRQTGITFIEYDSGYRTRAFGSSSAPTFNRFLPENRVIFLPDESQIAQVDSSPIGLGKMLTAPHVMGNNASGYYEWTQDTTDPWGQNVGTGIKAFPVFPHLEYTYTMDVTLPAEV